MYRPLAVGVVMTSRFSCRHIGVHVALHTYLDLVLYPASSAMVICAVIYIVETVVVGKKSGSLAS